ncbi:MFS general substrate transporter [Saitoella complicata NRRL Y-17804]|uniref:MFS general substrate transporter n=1 Tax=Saitoella complicata (strain BCRC 22490 / CBS 7301 / JCM 7358 / NBRC 10748 / NRRL Y-17804) TaxID=698492 RepID=UPI00086804D5|nr:MFS general substrate transporter [Saitoella complicata NRRL Y-17804]ODQ52578.1 MFS general substrate transporter [Saitoella complicata NRRL Y-17804]
MSSEEIKAAPVEAAIADANVLGEKDIQKEEAVVGIERRDTESTIDLPPDGGLKAWLVILGGFLFMVGTLGLNNSYGAFQSYYIDTLYTTTSPAVITLIGSLGGTVLMLLGAIVGRIVDKFGYRPCFIVGFALCVISLMLSSICNSIQALVWTQGILFGMGIAVGFTPAVSIPTQYFTKRRGFATGCVMAGSGLGGVLYPPLTRVLIDKVGPHWTLRIFGFLTIAIVAPSIFLLKPRQNTAFRRGPLFDFSALRNKRFVLAILAVSVGQMAVLPAYFFIGSFALSLGATNSAAVWFTAVQNGFGILGRIGCGFLADKFGKVNMLTVCYAISGTAYFCLWGIATGTSMLYACAAINGCVLGGISSLTPVVASHLAGDHQVASKIGLLLTFAGVTQLVAPTIISVVVEKTSYFKAGFTLGGMMYFSMLCMIGVRLMITRKFKHIC